MRINDEVIKSIYPSVTPHQLDQLYIYYETLVEESKKVNLTSITLIEDVYIKHFYDSILLTKTIDIKDKTLVDVGTGAGFPGLVLKIIEPSLKLVLVEPTTKRCNFLNLVIDKLQLSNVSVINDRAENCIKDLRESFDIATARAVSNLSILLELLTPFVKVDGYIVPLKGSDIDVELDGAKNAFKKLDLNLIKVDKYNLPKDKGERNILMIKKLKKTKTLYPRQYAKIKKQPL